jgi:hypothetical protein
VYSAFDTGVCHALFSPVTASKQYMPGLPRTWIDRRRRKLRRAQREALSRIGLATAGSPAAGETTMCIAYMCPWAHACNSAAPRPALVAQRDCARKFPEVNRPDSGLSDSALDNLAQQRVNGIRLESVTVGILDELRPDGPSPSMGKKRPALPVSGTGVRGRALAPRKKDIARLRKLSKVSRSSKMRRLSMGGGRS